MICNGWDADPNDGAGLAVPEPDPYESSDKLNDSGGDGNVVGECDGGGERAPEFDGFGDCGEGIGLSGDIMFEGCDGESIVGVERLDDCDEGMGLSGGMVLE